MSNLFCDHQRRRANVLSGASPARVPGQRRLWNCLLGSLCCVGLMAQSMQLPCCQAQENLDRVVIRDQTTGEEQRLSGRIVDYSGQFLTFQQLGGQPRQIKSQQVQKIQTTWTANHVRGDQLLAEHQFEQALATYQQAVKEETRNWARQRILAQWVCCYQSLGRIEEAGDTFLRLVLASDPNTLYFHTIPLHWGEQRVSPALEGQAAVWIKNAESGAAQLMGASWLLGTAQGGVAIQVLKQLTTGQDTRLALLAEAQLWRSQQASVSMKVLSRWEQEISRFPVSFRAGPYYLVAGALSRHQQHERAVICWMRVPISYPQHFHLAAESLLKTAKELTSLQREQQAENLYREIVRNYANTIPAGQAQQWLKQTENKSQPKKTP